MDRKKTLPRNLEEMGLVFDVNKSFAIPNNKRERVKIAKKLENGFVEEDNDAESEDQETPRKSASKKRSKLHVMTTLEEDANTLRVSKFRLPKGQVKFISDMMDKYGLNYKAMVKDIKNYDQLTWRQMRSKCRKLMSIPEQFATYLDERDLVDTEIDPNDPRWKESNTDIEDD